MTINRAQMAQLLWPGLNEVFGNYDGYPEQWKDIYDTYNSDKYQEVDVEMKYTSAADIKAEGAPIASDDMGQRVITHYIHKRVGLSFTITKEAIEDDLYKTQFPQQTKSLFNSLATTKNIFGANVLNNAFNPAFPVGDGQPLCSTAHPVDGGTYSNTLAIPADFSQASLEEAIVQIQGFVGQNGILVQTKAECLIMPKEQQFASSVVLDSQFRSGTANNDINAIYSNGYVPKGYKINQYLTSPDAWFIKTDAPNGFKHFQRTPVETETYADFQTDNIMAKATERYSFGVSNPRAVFGSSGA